MKKLGRKKKERREKLERRRRKRPVEKDKVVSWRRIGALNNATTKKCTLRRLLYRSK